ncbi:hypothetical protein QE369_000031 [Agrobacterium larrymoorei]|uniref:DUF4150 domain-containing protein n=1 Tax=Agrobacterium larrymoorei TaxID=160699 RepID=A0AAJ2B3Y1_9HYPH|nr:DUF4150 domain-containing protein [Agrobacterium larrymoorei]MDR6099853.1 hypothetical protein [Agrobacterium larrymoorei]
MSIPRDNYIGDPDYPAPWTTKKPREGLRDIDEARIVSLAPDVCLTPVGSSVVPIPYPVVDFCGHDKNYTPSVRFTRKKAMVMRSCTTHVHGDAPGVRKGVKSGTVESICEPIGYADQVRAEGSHVIRHLDRFWMNNRNTVGEAIFVRGTKTYDPPKDDDPVPGSLRWQNSSDEGRVLSDVSPGPLIMGAQYAQASPVQQPLPTTPSTQPVPRPAPPPSVRGSNVIQGPWQPRPPPTLPTQPGFVPNLLRYGRYGVMILPLMLSGDTPLIPWQPADVDPVEKELNNRARSLLHPFEGEYNRQVQRWYYQELESYRRHKREQQEEEQRRQQAVAQPETVRVDEEGSQRRCIVGPYSEIEPMCKGNAHHIVPDMSYRLGTRPTRAADFNSTANRIPNSPTFNQGMSICLLSRQHGSDAEGLHGQLRDKFSRMVSPVPGTAPMGAILRDSLRVIDDIPDLPAECKKLAKTLATGQVMTNTGLAAPGRIKERPLPTGEAEKVLRRGRY